ncbi:MAG: zinc ribbon domain-containing protein [Anaerolineales bacterium]|jgi:ribosomal protein L40E
MSEFFDRVRSTAAKAAFEAEKIRRINSVQSIIKSLKNDMNMGFYQTGQITYSLFQQGEINQPKLKTACENLLRLQNEIQAKEQEIEKIKLETLETPGPVDSRYGNLICPEGHGPLLAGTRFCMECGTEGVVNKNSMVTTCSNCGAEIQTDAKFCSSCGTPTIQPNNIVEPDLEIEKEPEKEHETVKKPPVSICINCGVELAPDASICPECGFSVEEPPPQTSDSNEFPWDMFSDNELGDAA